MTRPGSCTRCSTATTTIWSSCTRTSRAARSRPRTERRSLERLRHLQQARLRAGGEASARARGQIGGLDAELLRVLGVQSRPAELHGFGADDASDGLTGEQPLQHVEADVQARSDHRDESTVDTVPEREPRAAASQRLQLPADVEFAPVIFERLRRVGPLHLGLGYIWRRRPHRGELCGGASGAEVPVRLERSPFAEMLGVRDRRPYVFRRVRKVAHENQRPLLSVLLNLGAGGGTRLVLLTAAHVFFFPFTDGTFAILSRCRSRAS